MPVLRGESFQKFPISQIGGGKFPGNFLEISINFWPEVSGPKTSKHYQKRTEPWDSSRPTIATDNISNTMKIIHGTHYVVHYTEMRHCQMPMPIPLNQIQSHSFHNVKYFTSFRQLQSPSTRTLLPLKTSQNVSLIVLLSMTTNLYLIPASRSTKVSYPLLVLVIVLALPVTILVDPILTFQDTFVGSYGVSITILTLTLLLGVVVTVVLVLVVVVAKKKESHDVRTYISINRNTK